MLSSRLRQGPFSHAIFLASSSGLSFLRLKVLLACVHALHACTCITCILSHTFWAISDSAYLIAKGAWCRSSACASRAPGGAY